ncbi:MAG: DoxX family protein [Legionellales bacterium]
MALSASIINFGYLASRLCLSAVFIYSAVDKLGHWREGVDEVTMLKLPLPAVFVALTILIQFTGGSAVACGVIVMPAALLLATFTVIATLVGHRFWLLHGISARRELTTSLEHLAIVGGLCMLALHSLTIHP